MSEISLAKAYVQIIPSTEGMKSNLEQAFGSEAGGVGDKAGISIGKGMVSKIIGIVAAAQIGQKIVSGISDAISAGGELQQSIGGIETLFKESADTVIANANKAYETAGMSANEYMQNVTSFSASLLQSLGGDTVAAASAADQAMVDMSDNANKMGTDIASIQSAYQGFAKQNYTMLDNLKLGYGGTKSEMERLLKDAQEFSGVEYNIESLSDVYEAIHVIQGELDITGTTAKEASITLEGSMNAMKASFENLKGALALGEDVKEPLKQLVETASTFLMGNLMPMVGNLLDALPDLISTFAAEAVPQIGEGLTSIAESLTTALPVIIETFLSILPELLQVGIDIITTLAFGIADALPTMLPTIVEVITNLVEVLIDNIDLLIDASLAIIFALAEGLMAAIPVLLEKAPTLITKFVSALADNLPKLLAAGMELIGKLVTGIIAAIPQVLNAAYDTGEAFLDTFEGDEFDWKQIGIDMLMGLIKGIESMAGSLIKSCKELGNKALGAFKDIFNIQSPSKVFRDEVGKMIDLGLAEGISVNSKSVTDAIQEVSDQILFDSKGMFSGTVTRASKLEVYAAKKKETFDYKELAKEFANNMDGFALRVNEREFGRMVRAT